MKFSHVMNASVVAAKYAATTIVMTMTLPSRRVRKRRTSPMAPDPRAVPGDPGERSRAPSAGASAPVPTATATG